MADSPAAASRPAADVIDAVLENMRRNLEPLRYSTLAPNRYVVYLHPVEIARLSGILPLMRDETCRALAEELTALNRGSWWDRSVGRMMARAPRTPPVAPAGGDWEVEFLADADGDLAPGDIVVDSELCLPARPELGGGGRTRRITTVHVGGRVAARDASRGGQTARTGPVSVDVPALQTDRSTRPHARLTFADESGSRAYDIAKDSVTIGRGGTAYPVDVRIAASPDVSREHARVRRDPTTGRFFVIDLSSLGTTVDGRAIPRGYEELDGRRRENGVEVALGARARIGLADTVFLDFEILA